uniref:Uncharacterized protein n=1 Tax=Utricularia reniformis TaxID=192314 RepID=A0A1Y0B0X7_9LAMI|nr:hypothetical protein AEK19_MT0885 [Utricularia reniformis]ART31116.1 hypothetical protein AEK19_MT0885 [Utricularia reniformis]
MALFNCRVGSKPLRIEPDRNMKLLTDKAGTSTANEGWTGPGSQG